MKHLFFAFLLMLSLFGCCSVTPAKAPTGIIARLENETVALVRDEDHSVFCSGVWVGPAAILTAAHCVRGEDGENVQKTLYVAYSDSNGPFNEPAAVHVGNLYRIDITHDLALLHTEADTPPHFWASPALSAPKVGEPLHFVGHPDGFVWTYVHGYVAAYRKADLLPEDRRLFGPWMQVSAPVWLGNSGGGAFDSEGNLVGICSFKIKHNRYMYVEGMNFFVHLDTINAFLNG